MINSIRAENPAKIYVVNIKVFMMGSNIGGLTISENFKGTTIVTATEEPDTSEAVCKMEAVTYADLVNSSTIGVLTTD